MFKKYAAYFICAIVGAILALGIYQAFSPAITPETGKINTQPTAPKKFIDAAGTVHTENKVVQVENATGNEPQYQYLLDSIARILKQKNQYIKDLTAAKMEHAGTFIPIYIDTNGNQLKLNQTSVDSGRFKAVLNTRVRYKDKFLDLSGILNDDSSWKYKITESLVITTHEKKTGWFKRELVVDVSSTNPSTNIVGLTGIKIVPKPKKWSVGVNFSYSFNGTGFTPTVGIGLQRNIIRF